MASEYRVVGPPGTGKTTFLANQVREWASEYEPSRMVLTSFTRAAAAILAGRVAVPRENIATLHALCYRALGKPPIAETGTLAAEWDRSSIATSWRIGEVKTDIEEAPPEQGETGEMLAAYNLWRATERQNRFLEEKTRYFAQDWSSFKKETGSVDFADMIDLGVAQLPVCPGDPEVFIVDEAQDLTPVQWRLVRQWGTSPNLARFLIAGDPAQCIYSFAGARPDVFMQPVKEERLLGRSWRLPGEVQAFAERWLSQHSPPMSEGRIYQSRNEKGQVRRLNATWQQPQELVTDVCAQVDAGRSVMILASCAYMLDPTLKHLRDIGLPYHNPYRRRAGQWNPLQSVREDKTSTVDRLIAYLGMPWGKQTAAKWLEMLPAKLFQGPKTQAIATLPSEHLIYPADLIDVLNEETLATVGIETSPMLLADCILNKYERTLRFAAACYERGDIDALLAEPRCVIGTIHSVKGGEADSVYLYPDVSRAGYAEARDSTAGRDAQIRQFYVGLTRARQEVIIASPLIVKLSVFG